MTNKITILEPWKRFTITGTFVKRYPLGVTLDDENGIRYYATFDRIVSGLEQSTAKREYVQGSLF